MAVAYNAEGTADMPLAGFINVIRRRLLHFVQVIGDGVDDLSYVVQDYLIRKRNISLICPLSLPPNGLWIRGDMVFPSIQGAAWRL